MISPKLLLCSLVSIASVFAQGCGSQTFSLPDAIVLPADLTSVQVKFDLSETPGVTVHGGAGLVATQTSYNAGVFVNITSWGDLNPPGQSQSSSAYASRSMSYIFLCTVAGVLSVLSMRRFELRCLLVVMAVALFAQEATSACSVMVSVSGTDNILVMGDVTSKLTITCADGSAGTKSYVSDYNATMVTCQWIGKFTRVYSSPNNNAACAALAPVNVTVAEGQGNAGLKLNNMPTIVSVQNASLQQALYNGPVDELAITLYSGVILAQGGSPVDMLLQRVDPNHGDNSDIFPVVLKSGDNVCKFGYKCVGGSCLEYVRNMSGTCVEFGFEPASTDCLARGNGTGMHCGQNCTQFTCLAMCPGYDCTNARPCMSSDPIYPCHNCQCPQSCNQMSEGGYLKPGATICAFLLAMLFVVSA